MGCYREEEVVDGLSYEDAIALYWRKPGELTAPAANAAADRPEPRQRLPSQLSFKL
jgi:hypothetical protein